MLVYFFPQGLRSVCSLLGIKKEFTNTFRFIGCGWLVDWLHLSSGPHTPDAPRPYLTGPFCPMSNHGSPVALLKFQMAPMLILMMSSGSKKKEPRCACLSKATASHSQRMWAKVYSFTPHLLHNGLSSCPSRWRCLLRVLWPVRRPVTALDCVILKDRNLALAPRLGPVINSRACVCVSPRPRHFAQCWFTNERLSLFHTSRLETTRASLGPRNPRAEPPKSVLLNLCTANISSYT